MRTSYEENGYGEVIKFNVQAWRPKKAVELGVLDGYSALAIGAGLAQNRRQIGLEGTLDAWDLFDDYTYKHGNLEEVRNEVMRAGLGSIINVQKGDAFEVHRLYQPESIDLLHVDLSNTGKTVQKIMELWDEKIDRGGVVLFEGGTEERDQVEWMVKYGCPPMKPEIESNPVIEAKYVYATYLPFPGLTVMLKKRL